MDLQLSNRLLTTRRHFFGAAGLGIGAAALASLLDQPKATAAGASGALPGLPHFAPKAKRVIYLFQSGAPSQMDLFDYKPRLREWHTTELPDSVRHGQRLTGMTSRQTSFPIAASKFKFAQHGQSGAWVSELLPHTARVADRLVFRQVDAHRGHQSRPGDHVLPNRSATGRAGRASGPGCRMAWEARITTCRRSWCLISQGTGNPNDQPLYDRLWGSGFLPSKYQGVKFRGSGDPVLYLSNPPGIDDATRRDGCSTTGSAQPA